ncbi:MAG TPA: 50S ribosomal protein L30e [Candidatus Korarchaeota archaeon]|nr:50S ribosomal protein L30e [Candidatus Korarchaeota archaeon]
MPELDSEIWLARKTGRVEMGIKKVRRLLVTGNEKPKLVILATNIDEDTRAELEYLAKLSGVPVLLYEAGSLQLGRALHKPFFVSAVAILDQGESSILDIVREGGGKDSEQENSTRA